VSASYQSPKQQIGEPVSLRSNGAWSVTTDILPPCTVLVLTLICMVTKSRIPTWFASFVSVMGCAPTRLRIDPTGTAATHHSGR
jgi:hypothetical protein